LADPKKIIPINI